MSMTNGKRRLADPLEGIETLSLETFQSELSTHTGEPARVSRLLQHFDQIVDVSAARDIAVVGCGPRPEMIAILTERGYTVTGVEPIPLFVDAAEGFLRGKGRVIIGCAERLPFEDASLDIVFFENVLEHVESPSQCMLEMYRVLRPGGLVLVTTTNRHRFSVTGNNDEFTTPFFNWLPGLIQESYVHRQLHFEPALANMTERPAVHWFSFRDLCRLGREAGFARFYSTLDTRTFDADVVTGNLVKRLFQRSPFLLRVVQRNPWLRSIALTQIGQDCMMWKRAGN